MLWQDGEQLTASPTVMARLCHFYQLMFRCLMAPRHAFHQNAAWNFTQHLHWLYKNPLFGPDQGSTTGPPFWLVVFFAIVESLDPTIGHSIFTLVSGRIRVNSTGTAFIVDSSLGVTSTYQWDPNLISVENHNEEIRQIMGRLRKLAQQWERLLFSTGGAINMQKSHGIFLLGGGKTAMHPF